MLILVMEWETRRVMSGEHALFLEAPDLLVVRLRGDLTAVDVARYVEVRAKLMEGSPYLLLLVDLHDLRSATPDARGAIARIRERRPQATAYLGASFAARVVVEMIMKAFKAFGRDNLIARAFEGEVQARVFLDEMRGRWAGMG